MRAVEQPRILVVELALIGERGVELKRLATPLFERLEHLAIAGGLDQPQPRALGFRDARVDPLGGGDDRAVEIVQM